MFRRHPVLTACGLLLLGGALAIGLFLYRFDLNRYRSDLEQTLSAALGQPVRLGHAHFAFKRGIGLQFDDVRVGTDAAGGLIEADRLALRLELFPLLQRRLSFDRLYLERPRLYLTFAAGLPQRDGEVERSLQLLQEVARITRVRSLLISQGSVTVSDQRRGEALRWSLEGCDLLLTDLALEQPITLSATARLVRGDSSTALSLSGTLTLPTAAAAWRTVVLNLRLDAQGVASTPWLSATAPVRADGAGDLRLDLSGSPATGLRLRAEITGRDLALTVPDWYRRPLAVGRLEINGTWTTEGTVQRLGDFVCDWDGLRLSGTATFPAGFTLAGMTAELRLAAAPLTRLLPLVPDHLAPQFADGLRRNLRTGTVSDVQLSLQVPSAGTFDPLTVLRQGSFLLRDGSFTLPRLGEAHAFQLRGSWQDGLLRLIDGRCTLAAGSLNFSGDARFAPGAPVRLRLQADGTLDAAGAIRLLPLPAASRQVAAGSASVNFTASGTPEHLSLNLQADLRQLGLALFGATIKASGDPGDLFAVAEIRAGIVDLGLARLTLPAGEIHASGRVFLDPPHAFRVLLDLSRLDLEQLTRHDELARLLRVSGEAALHLDLAGDDQGIQQREGWLDVRQLSLHFAGVVADLNRAGGRLRFAGDRAIIEGARGYLGSSVLTGTGSLALGQDFRLDLDLRGESLLAADLVFPSDRQRLSELTGHVTIDSHGILFERIAARLGSGTRAIVDGQLLGYTNPHLELGVVAEQADIGEILSLWEHPREPNPYKHPPGNGSHGPGLTLRIEGQVARGNLFGLPFRNGTCTVTLRDGILQVHPAQFETGAGFCRGQAVLRELGAAAPLLTVTGHVEKAEASAVYNQMLGRRGLVSGRLAGDFAIEGRIGSGFLASSQGGFSLQVEDGELRQFPVLSKVFSLLNVSQIFSLRLPDLTAEGMPFRQLRATVRLHRGVLRSEDLVVRSDAMNLALVGDYDLPRNRLDLILAVKPLATVDKVFASIPLAGWVLTGQDKTLITAQFRVAGSGDTPEVDAIPITSVSDTVVGIFKRLFGLPAKVIDDLQGLVEGEKK